MSTSPHPPPRTHLTGPVSLAWGRVGRLLAVLIGLTAVGLLVPAPLLDVPDVGPPVPSTTVGVSPPTMSGTPTTARPVPTPGPRADEPAPHTGSLPITGPGPGSAGGTDGRSSAGEPAPDRGRPAAGIVIGFALVVVGQALVALGFGLEHRRRRQRTRWNPPIDT